MTDAELLSLTKSNLQIISTNPIHDDYLTNLIGVAKEEIKREGITLDLEALSDCNLVVMYAAYLFRKRASDGGEVYTTTAVRQTGMPRMLRYALNNRVFSEKAAADE